MALVTTFNIPEFVVLPACGRYLSVSVVGPSEGKHTPPPGAASLRVGIRVFCARDS